MKKLIIVSMLAGIVFSTGCASVYNHNRVKNNMIESRILASGNEKAIDLLSKGVKPADVVKFAPTSDGAGVSVAFDLSDLSGLKAYFSTFKEAPISSTVSLIVDGAATYYASKLLGDDSGSSGSGGDGNVNVSVDNSSGTTINVNTERDDTTTTTTTTQDNREQYSE